MFGKCRLDLHQGQTHLIYIKARLDLDQAARIKSHEWASRYDGSATEAATVPYQDGTNLEWVIIGSRTAPEMEEESDSPLRQFVNQKTVSLKIRRDTTEHYRVTVRREH